MVPSGILKPLRKSAVSSNFELSKHVVNAPILLHLNAQAKRINAAH